MAKMVTNTTTPIALPTMVEVCVGVAGLGLGSKRCVTRDMLKKSLTRRTQGAAGEN